VLGVDELHRLGDQHTKLRRLVDPSLTTIRRPLNERRTDLGVACHSVLTPAAYDPANLGVNIPDV
jgi:hypothetical protein